MTFLIRQDIKHRGVRPTKGCLSHSLSLTHTHAHPRPRGQVEEIRPPTIPFLFIFFICPMGNN